MDFWATPPWRCLIPSPSLSDSLHIDDFARWESLRDTFHPPARLAVIGDPVSHSRSPQMHNPALQAAGIDAQYIRIQVPVGSVKPALQAVTEAGFLGVNVTIPHKFEALQAVDHLEHGAGRLGAVNTIAIRDGVTTGYNTDGPGFVRAVREAFQADLRDLRILILGAGGGAGRAVAAQCVMEGCWRLVLANRTPSKAALLARELRQFTPAPCPVKDLSHIAWEDGPLFRELDNIDLIVNATPLGMKPGDPALLPPGSIRPHHLVFDMVYRHGGTPTPLIEQAIQAGAKSTDGLLLLLHQGALSFGHWFQQSAPLEVMRKGLQES